MKTSIFVLIAALFVVGCVQEKDSASLTKILGERTSGEEVPLLDTVNGKIIAKLKGNVLIETDSLNEKQKLICFTVRLTKAQEVQSKIKPNEKLISTNGEVIGYAIDTIELSMVDEKEGYVFGYLNSDQIKEESIPELALQKLIDNGSVDFKTLTPYMSSFKFQPYGTDEKNRYKEYFIYESTVVDVSAMDRISLLFSSETNKLIGIFHSRPLNIKNKKKYELIRGHKFTLVANISNEEVGKILAERLKSYQSSD
jgi:hypothetical protein